MAAGSREIVERFAEALATADLDAQAELLHDDIIDEYPQSGERIRGKANMRAIVERYPGTDVRPLHGRVSRTVGAEDTWMVGPSFNVTHITGSGDEFVSFLKVTYPNGETWDLIQLIRLKDSRIWRLTTYFGAPFEAPEWRAAYVERMEGAPGP